MNKKVTVRDVAREAGVSVATVSYIMNNRQDVKISEQTRKKVLQIANLLDYSPSSAAKSLATGRNNIIGVSYRLSDHSPSRNLEVTGFVNLLIEQLNRLKYNVLYMPIKSSEDNIPINRNIDGIIAIDLSTSDFRELADSYMVPIIAVDMLVNDDLFYQVCSNIPTAIERAFAKYPNAVLVTERFSNEAYMDFITANVPSSKLQVLTHTDVDALKQLSGRQVIAIGSYLALMLRPYVAEDSLAVIASQNYVHLLPSSTDIIEVDITQKANMSINLLLNALDRKFEVNHKHILDI
ncbi:MAG: LacI family DNA-binding transcriptional regulator [Lachnospiraceae bacterium]|nr:LacI family DNA-binding transcriptional regulator [Lachnospiraceae bacterium]